MKAKYYFIFSLLLSQVLINGMASTIAPSFIKMKCAKCEFQPLDSIVNNGLQFGFANESGNQILMLDPGDQKIIPSNYTKTIGTEGKVISVRFVKEKKATSADNHRQTKNNFENSGGYLYEVINGTVRNDNSVLLMTEEFINNYKTISFTRPENRLSVESNIGKKIESERKWKINSSILLTRVNESLSIYMLVYKPQGDSMLADLVLTGLSENVYFDYPAHKSENSTWRVDDGGEFGEEYFTVLAIFTFSDKYLVITDWVGAEGYSIQVFETEGNRFMELKTSYRYAAPL
jgi:hypothetical protein